MGGGSFMVMNVNELLDKPLREILEEYCCINNLEWGYYYGVTSYSLIEDLFDEYNIEEYSEAFNVEGLVSDEILVSYDDDLLDYDKLRKIMENLGIHKKSDV